LNTINITTQRMNIMYKQIAPKRDIKVRLPGTVRMDEVYCFES